MNGPLQPLNRTARLTAAAAGNPASALLASGVANCFPGLEYDHRNLDRRFFPGLVFEFDNQLDLASMGAVVVGVDLDDPMLQDPEIGTPALLADLGVIRADLGAASVSWWLATVEQEGVLIDPATVGGWPLIGSDTWRLVRSLEAAPVRIVVRRFEFDAQGENRTPTGERTLPGVRRPYLVAGSTIDPAFPAGELSQSLCSPWQHDFRDCGCYYWASNHPDIALDGTAEQPLPPGTGWVPWLRAQDPSDAEREMGYYEISERYQDLAIVLRDAESAEPYRPGVADEATPYGSPDELVSVLRDQLAPLEHVLILEYLYAWSSVRSPAEVDQLGDEQLAQILPVQFRADPSDPLGGLSDPVAATGYLSTRLRRDVTFIREQLRNIAISEMRHLSWVNLLLRRLAETNLGPPYAPALDVAATVPTGDPAVERRRALRPVVAESVADFEGVERPSGSLEGRYARVRATLLEPEYPQELYDIASRIVDDGVDHYGAFRRMAMIIAVYDQTPPPYLRPGFSLASPTEPAVQRVLSAQQQVTQMLREGYAGAAGMIEAARQMMLGELEPGLDVAGAQGLGVPLFAP